MTKTLAGPYKSGDVVKIDWGSPDLGEYLEYHLLLQYKASIIRDGGYWITINLGNGKTEHIAYDSTLWKGTV